LLDDLLQLEPQPHEEPPSQDDHPHQLGVESTFFHVAVYVIVFVTFSDRVGVHHEKV